jgi:hypothetical protein
LFQNLVEDGGEVIHGDDLSAINPLEEGWEEGSFRGWDVLLFLLGQLLDGLGAAHLGEVPHS